MSTINDKFLVRGAESLSDVELLSLLLDECELSVAQRLLDHFSGSLSQIGLADLSRLRMFEGLGMRRAVRLSLAAEWGRRVSVESASALVVIGGSVDVVNIFRPLMETLDHEECWVLYLNSANGVIEQQRVSQGGITTTVVDHRLVVKRALELLATKLVLVHNHPSGSSVPSVADDKMTRRVKEAAALFEIELLDHIIVAQSTEYSYKSAGRL